MDLQDFDFLFPTLQADPANLLPESTQTVARLKALAATMEDLDELGGDNDSEIPAAYTYFGQFVDHDVTFEVQPADLPPSESESLEELLAEDMVPLPLPAIRNAVRNFRTATLDLDSLYGLPAPRDYRVTRPTAPRCASARLSSSRGDHSRSGRRERATTTTSPASPAVMTSCTTAPR